MTTTTTTKTAQPYRETTHILGRDAVAYLRVHLDGSTTYLHSETQEWVDLQQIMPHLTTWQRDKLRSQIARELQQLRDQTARDAYQAAWSEEVLVQTNSGTYGDGDPQFDDYAIWERVGDGRRRLQGADPKEAKGRPRYLNSRELKEKRAALRSLKAE